MKISGFTFVRNAEKLYYPVKESIQSILPIVDEFIVALGPSDDMDNTRKIIESINSDKIKIIETTWDIVKYNKRKIYAQQTDLAKSHCSGDWLFYLQSDEVIHEKYLNHIKEMCTKYVDKPKVEGFVFKYKHFWGDYNHFMDFYGWYQHEVRIIRNIDTIHSWKDAQSFRKIPNFDGVSYFQYKNTYKLNVIELDAYVYHYGWVRPPHLMRMKNNEFQRHFGKKKKTEEDEYVDFDYGALGIVPIFKESHPKIMLPIIDKMDWKDKLNYTKKRLIANRYHSHTKLKNRIITYLFRYVFFGKHLWGFNNFIKLNPKKIS